MTYLCKGSLRDILRENRYNITSFSAVANVSRSGLTNACQGKAISERNAKLIAKGLKQPLKTLFEESHSGETLSAETISKYHRVLSSIFQTAVEWQVIVSNPCERVKPPKGEKEDAIFLNAEQAIHLLELLENAPIYYATAVTVLLFTGMRRGELLGLEWSDIDLKHQLISISRTSQYLPDRGIFDDQTKNHSSKRVIRIADSTVQSLKRLRAWQNQQRLKLGELWNGSTKVFTTATGKPIHPDTLSGWFHKFILRTDLPPVHLHSLRHTNATLAITNGVAVTTVAGQLGHSSPNTTTKIYAHTIQQAQAEAAEMMDDLLAPKKKRTHSA
jgi:integrase